MNRINKAIHLIKKFEGFSPIPYICPGDCKTIGYGHINHDDLNIISQKDAEILLYQDVCNVLVNLINVIKVELNDNQINALISFVFNIGPANFSKSTMLKLINYGKIDLASKEFNRWIYAKGKRLEGLVTRRGSERTLFDSIK